jgi:hypothetical protein
MKINSRLIAKYLATVTESYRAYHDSPGENLADYDAVIDEMGAAARAADDDDLLRVAIDALIAGPVGRLGDFTGDAYSWPSEEFIPLLTRAYQRLWPDDEPSMEGFGPEVEFEPMSSEEWAAYTGRV